VNLLQHHTRRGVSRLLRGARERRDLRALQILAPLAGAYVPWGPFALRPSALVTVLDEITVGRRRRIVELGGGVSTLYIARLLRAVGGHLHTLEHDKDWVGLLEQQLDAEGLRDVVTVVHAPLARTWYGWTPDCPWYAEEDARRAAEAGPVDLLLVDGPPAYRPDLRHARYPALPFFADALAPGATVILDDIHRRGEHDVVERWEAQFTVRFARRYTDGGIALGRLHPAS
jgi:predicted O-methyltransferase YrrM